MVSNLAPMSLSQLTAADLNRSAVWEVRGPADTLAEVSPAPDQALTEADARVFIATTDFVFADGSTAVGFCSPSDPSALDYTQPVVFFDDAQIPLWVGPTPRRAEVEAAWRRHGKPIADVFPLAFACRVPVDGKTLSGVILLEDLTVPGH
jgi:hypothetical protein